MIFICPAEARMSLLSSLSSYWRTHAFAQTQTTGRIAVTVKDEQGAVIAGAAWRRCRRRLTIGRSGPSHHNAPTLGDRQRAGFVERNDFTTMLFGCTPAGIIVSSPYSPGSSLRGLRF